jgi:hypothetical protein
MVSLYLMGDDLMVIENFRDEAVSVTLETEFSMDANIKIILPATEIVDKEFCEKKLVFKRIPPRALVGIKY